MNRGGVSASGRRRDPLWLNRMLLPDTVGTGGDSHTRSRWYLFPAGSGLVAFARRDRRDAAGYAGIGAGAFKAKCGRGHLRDSGPCCIPLYAIKQGLLTVEKKARKTSSLAAHHGNRRSAGSRS